MDRERCQKKKSEERIERKDEKNSLHSSFPKYKAALLYNRVKWLNKTEQEKPKQTEQQTEQNNSKIAQLTIMTKLPFQ